MNFFKQAQEFAASANVNTDNEEGAKQASGGFGSHISEASSMLKTHSASDDVPAEQANLPGGRHAPSNQELMESTKLLFGAAQGQKVENTKLAGAAEDLLGGLAAHGKLDQGQYASYINQAEGYLHKYSGEGQSAARAAPAPAEEEGSEVRRAEREESETSPAPDADAAPVKAPSADEDAPEKFSLSTSAPSWMNDRA